MIFTLRKRGYCSVLEKLKQNLYNYSERITYGKLVNGVDVCKFGKQWVVSMEAMKHEYGEPVRT